MSDAQRGQSLVTVILMLTVLIGLTGAALTVGTVYYAHTRLQNAVDAAALAGAQVVSTSQSPGSQAALITQDDPGASGTVSWNADPRYPNTVVANGMTTVPGGFAQLFGIAHFSVRAHAVASPAPGWPFDFAIFQGSSSHALRFNGGGVTVDGSIHGNSNVIFNGGNNTVTGVVSAAGTISPSPPSSQGNNFGATEPNAPYIPMPQWNPPALPSPYQTVTPTGSTWTIDKNISGNFLVNGSVDIAAGVTVNGSIEATDGITLSGGGDTINGNLLAVGPNSNITVNGGGNTFNGEILTEGGGNITFNGGGTNLGPNQSALVLAALPEDGLQGGSITFNGGGNSNAFPGVFYAPDGTLTFDGGGNTFLGSLVAELIKFNGGGTTVQWDAAVVDNVPLGEPVLIQ